jgi:hypothetical protein
LNKSITGNLIVASRAEETKSEVTSTCDEKAFILSTTKQAPVIIIGEEKS